MTGALRWVEELINTRSVESSTDEIATPALLANWLRERSLLPPGVSVTIDEHHRGIRIREGLRALAAVNNAAPGPADRARGDRSGGDGPGGDRLSRPGAGGPALADLARLARRLPLVLDAESRPPRLVPLSRGTADAVFASLLAAVAESVANGTWNRLKVCREADCRWAYYDHSRNQSRAWCSMAVCGNRAKARAFRRRAR